jgi:hypothetical protein
MRQLTRLMIFVGSCGLFASGFVFWMANSAHRDAERLRRHGEYCDVEVIRKEKSSDADASSMSYYVHVKPVNRADRPEPIQCEVHYSTYEQLYVGQKLKAWVLGGEALLDLGPSNTATVARGMLVNCVGFAVLTIAGVVLKVYYRTGRSSEPPPSLN